MLTTLQQVQRLSLSNEMNCQLCSTGGTDGNRGKL